MDAFIKKQKGEERQEDCRTLVRLLSSISRAKPRMWGTSIVGFGTYPLTYADGSVREWPVLAFSPRKQDLVVYILGLTNYAGQLARLGPHKTGKVCLYLKRLADVKLPVLKAILVASYKDAKQRYG
ncbi:MAG: DUF1801 domain-containing protein [Gemmatimonadetes bacterium]|nr:DUF1801 domain-containing protein [Gemmatimonadota bacterium]